jgi:hypothetical protein
LTLWSGQTYQLTNVAITNTHYSTAKVPAGFDMNPESWTIQFGSTTARTTISPTAGTWYTAENVVLPIGIWNVIYSCSAGQNRSGGGDVFTGLVVYSGNIDDGSVCVGFGQGYASSDISQVWPMTKTNTYNITTQTTVSLDYKTSYSGTAIVGIYGATQSNNETVINAFCAYL